MAAPDDIGRQVVDPLDLSCEEAPAQRAVGDKADAQLPAGVQDVSNRVRGDLVRMGRCRAAGWPAPPSPSPVRYTQWSR
jgi:hypothetical protein